MGWGLGREPRTTLLAASAAALKKTGIVHSMQHPRRVGRPGAGQKVSSVNLDHIKWPTTRHDAFGDMNALCRSKVAPGMPAMAIARSVMKTLLSSGPANVHMFFDLVDIDKFPPQRRLLHAKRYGTTARPFEEVMAVLKMFGCSTIEELADVDPHNIPLMNSTTINWSVVFSTPALKPFAWRVFEAASMVVATEMASLPSSTWPADRIVRIYCSDGTTVREVTRGKTSSRELALDADFGEGDLRVFYNAAMGMTKGVGAVIHTIDTDLLLLAVASAWFVPECPFMLSLKTSVYNMKSVIMHMGGHDRCARLNAAFWMMSVGTDYSNSLTNNGYYVKDLVSLMTGRETVPFCVDATGLEMYDLLGAQRRLKELRCRTLKTKQPEKSVPVTLSDILFCVKYYGLLFDRKDMFPAYVPATEAYKAGNEFVDSSAPLKGFACK